jgi:GT2 family glycosyltransferase
MIDLSIVIPTYNRKDCLVAVLDRLGACRREGFTTETIVVDDGSTDGSADAVSGRDDIVLIRQKNSGPATARNRGAGEARGRFVLFLGDDIIADHNLLTVHMAALREDPKAAVLGYVTWDPAIRITPFMRYLTEKGIQFDFANIKDPERVSPEYFYTANISLARSWLMEEPFDPAFPWACVEDIELAFRLVKKGLRIIYRPEASGLHRHDISFKSYLRRCGQSGKSTVIFQNKHPEVPVPLTENTFSFWFRAAAPALRRIVDLLDRRGIPVPGPLYYRLLTFYFLRGYREEMATRQISGKTV